MLRSLALLILAVPVVALGQQVDSTAPMTVSSRIIGVTDSVRDSTTAHDAANAQADVADAAADSVFLRAQRMVAAGQGDAGRALVQAQLDSAPMGSPRYVRALYWRAVVAATAAGAERDLRRIVIEYPLSAESADALLRLAQLEMARGDRQLALEHLDRLLLEHPDDPSRGRAAFWMGQLLFEKGQAPAACARLAQAELATPAQEVELRNQIEYYKQRCVGVDTSAAARASTSSAASAVPASVPAPVPAPAPTSPPAYRANSGPAPRPAPATKDSAPASRERRGTSHSAAGARYTIQVAAFRTSAAAERLRDGLAARGLDARVVEGGKYYRVRIGRYTTRRSAVEAAKRMKAQHIDGLVMEMEPR